MLYECAASAASVPIDLSGVRDLLRDALSIFFVVLSRGST